MSDYNAVWKVHSEPVPSIYQEYMDLNEYTHAELYFFANGHLCNTRYYSEETAKMPVIPLDENLRGLSDGGIESRLLYDGCLNVASAQRLKWIAEKEGEIPPEFIVEEIRGDWSKIVIQFYKDMELKERMSN